jgi:DNA polymerase-3 subunit epsilon
VAADIIDTLALAREHFPGKKNNLDALCERFGVANAHRTLHGAMLDAQLLAEVYLAMTRGQESLTIDIAIPMAIIDGTFAEETLAAVRVLVPSAEELDLHQAYLAELQRECRGVCLWVALTP